MSLVDPDRRSAARIATIIAVPIAIAVAATSLWIANRSPHPSEAPAGAEPTTPVSVAAAPPGPADGATCDRLLLALPDRIGEATRRPTTTTGTAAYGEPAITIACGGPATSYPATGTLWPINGVCWYGETRATAAEFSSVDRATTVRVTIPTAYEGQAIAEFSAAVAETIDAVADIPAACR